MRLIQYTFAKANPKGFAPVKHSVKILLFSAFLGLQGCALVPTLPSEVLGSVQQQSSVELKDVPFFSQEDYFCGPSSLAMVLNHQGARTNPQDLVKFVYVPDRKGSLQIEMLAAPRQFGQLAYQLEPNVQSLFNALNAGYPALVLLNLSLQIAPQWHYAVVVGYGADQNTIVLRSGKNEREEMPLATFLKLWERSKNWGFAVIKPDATVPAFATAQNYLNAVVGLERTDASNALLAYQRGAEAWPNEPWFYFGAGNIHFAAKRYIEAEQSFSKAVSVYPDMADAWNNLAETQLQLGRKNEARAAINKAISLGGKHIVTYRETAEKIN